MAKIRKGDQVIVIAGKEKGKQGTVLSVSNDQVKVEGLNLVKKHQKPNRATGAEGSYRNSGSYASYLKRGSF